jgi:hypothetical protein
VGLLGDAAPKSRVGETLRVVDAGVGDLVVDAGVGETLLVIDAKDERPKLLRLVKGEVTSWCRRGGGKGPALFPSPISCEVSGLEQSSKVILEDWRAVPKGTPVRIFAPSSHSASDGQVEQLSAAKFSKLKSNASPLRYSASPSYISAGVRQPVVASVGVSHQLWHCFSSLLRRTCSLSGR